MTQMINKDSMALTAKMQTLKKMKMNMHGFTCTSVMNTYITKKSRWMFSRVSPRKQLYRVTV